MTVTINKIKFITGLYSGGLLDSTVTLASVLDYIRIISTATDTFDAGLINNIYKGNNVYT